MLDWKILAASLVALLVISSLFLGAFGIQDFFGGIAEQIGRYTGADPLANLPAGDAPEEEPTLTLVLRPASFALTPSAPATIRSGETVISGFAGDMAFSFQNQTATLRSKDIQIAFPLVSVEVTSLRLARLQAEAVPFSLPPDVAADEGALDLRGFSGRATATPEGLTLEGSADSLSFTIGGNTYQRV
ncbi:MAG: hypothetical protein HY520_05255 [Candidatus Aenigmarchaeota archaeon]|nr:hypothetical protein [Candidatus Aenigmarchaeota archaeon]